MNFAIKSFYDIPSYKEALKWGFLRSTLYFLFLCVLFAASAFVTIYAPIRTGYSENIDGLKDALSRVKIVGGKIQAYKGPQIQIKDAHGNVYGIISETFIDATKTKGLIFSIEGTRLSMYQGSQEMSLDLSQMQYGGVENLAQTLPPWNTVRFVVMPAMTFAAALSVNFWNMLTTGMLILIIDIPRRLLRMSRCIKLAMLSSTPALALNLLYALAFGQFLPNFAILTVSAGMAYFVYVKIGKTALPERK